MTKPTKNLEDSIVDVWNDNALTCRVVDGLAEVTLHSQRLHWGLVQQLVELFKVLGNRSDVRAVLIESQFDDFSHGADLSDPRLLQAVAKDQGRTVAETGARLINGLVSLPVPTVAVLSGHVIGGGACLAFACDFRVSTADARVSFPEIDRGMHLSWDIIPRLVSECGVGLTRRLTILGERMRAADFPPTVMEIADDPGTAGRRLAQRLASKPACAARLIKEAIRCAANAENATRTDADRFVESLQSQEFAAVMASWLDRNA